MVLVYKIPREPAAGRVYVWRKLKRLGALLVHDAVWLLPATPWTREQFQWLAVEIKDLGGEALVWESRMVLPSQDETLVQQFVAEASLSRCRVAWPLRHVSASFVTDLLDHPNCMDLAP
jgi:hypothetical protein